MLEVTFQGNPAYLLDDDCSPDWANMELQAALPSHVADIGLTGIETRRGESNALRFSLTYSATLTGDAVPKFRNALQDLNTQPVLCPFWMDYFDAGDSPTMEADYYVLMGDGSTPEIKPHADLPFARPAYPLMVGIIDDRPTASLLCGETVNVTIRFAENDALYLTLPAFAPSTALADASGASRPLFPWRPNWDRKPSELIDDNVARETVGQGRESADCYFEGRARRQHRQYFTLTNGEPWQLLRLFQDHGPSQNFWLPGGMTEAALTANVAAIDTALTVDSPSSRGDNVHLLIDDLTNRTAVKVTSTAGNNWNLSAAVGQAYNKSFARVESLVLARFERAVLTVQFRGSDTATANITFIEVPWETSVVAGETFGTTFGGLPKFSYLYVFSMSYPGATQTWRYTSFERDLNDGSNDFTSVHIEHDQIRETASLERHETNLKSRYFTGNPLALFVPFRLEWPLRLEIYECDVSGGSASNKRCLFVGEVSRVRTRGPFIDATAKSLSAQHDRKIPKSALQTNCNFILFDAPDPITGRGCGLDPADWTWNGNVVSYDATTRELALSGVARVSGVAPILSANYFAGGYLYFGLGQAAQYRAITRSTAEVAGALTLLLATPLTTAPAVAAAITFHPGCQGRYSPDCITKFSNGERFGGMPYMPVGNPTMLRPKNNSSPGKK